MTARRLRSLALVPFVCLHYSAHRGSFRFGLGGAFFPLLSSVQPLVSPLLFLFFLFYLCWQWPTLKSSFPFPLLFPSFFFFTRVCVSFSPPSPSVMHKSKRKISRLRAHSHNTRSPREGGNRWWWWWGQSGGGGGGSLMAVACASARVSFLFTFRAYSVVIIIFKNCLIHFQFF